VKKQIIYIIHFLSLFIGITFLISLNAKAIAHSHYTTKNQNCIDFVVKKTSHPCSIPLKETTQQENTSNAESEQELENTDFHLSNSPELKLDLFFLSKRSLTNQTLFLTSSSSKLFLWHCAFII
jgi:hypothetical protein